jgi:hypothetical protein
LIRCIERETLRIIPTPKLFFSEVAESDRIRMRSCKLRIAVCSAGLAVPQGFSVACGDWMRVHGKAHFQSLKATG